MKTESWGSLLVQENYHAERLVTRDNIMIVIIIIIIIIIINEFSILKPLRHTGNIVIAPPILNISTTQRNGWLDAPTVLSPRRNSSTHSIGHCVNPRASLDVLEKRKYLPSKTPAASPQSSSCTNYTTLAYNNSNSNWWRIDNLMGKRTLGSPLKTASPTKSVK